LLEWRRHFAAKLIIGDQVLQYRVRDTAAWNTRTLSALGINCYTFGCDKGIIVEDAPAPGQHWGGPSGTRGDIGFSHKSAVQRGLILTAINLRCDDLRKELQLCYEEANPQNETVDEEQQSSDLLMAALRADAQGLRAREEEAAPHGNSRGGACGGGGGGWNTMAQGSRVDWRLGYQGGEPSPG
jgi:hypothetical protein